MSRTTTIEYDDRSFWVFDEARAIWLKYLIDAVGLRISSGSATHFAASLDSWRVSATVGDFAMTLGPWTPDERDEFLQINSEACSALAASQPLALADASSWTLLANQPLVRRLTLWDDPIDIRPILELGQAVADLVNGTLEDPPPGTQWFFGSKDGRQTMAIHSSTEA